MLLLIPLIAMAQSPTPAQQSAFTGVYVSADTDAALEQQWQAEVDRVVATLPWIVRGLVRSKLRDKRPHCAELNLDLTADTFAVQCTGQDRLQRRFDGAGEPLLNDDDAPVDVVLEALTDAIRFDLSSPSGTIASRYSLLDDMLIVTTTTHTPRIAEPFHWNQRYRRK